MTFSGQQCTLRAPVQLQGFGYWSCEDVLVELHPAGVHEGRYFVRHDVSPRFKIPARVEYRVEAPRRTSLARNGVRVDMVEHILAALAALQVDNCEIRCSHPELPAFDGSCLPIVEAILQAGVQLQPASRSVLNVQQPVRLGDERAWIEAWPASVPGLSIEYHLDYGPGPIGQQSLQMHLAPERFLADLAAARSFLLLEEAEQLRRFGQGWRVTYENILVFGPHGPIQNSLRFPDECVRHKVLDLLGDLALTGYDIQGRIVAYRSGHQLNAQLARALQRQHVQWSFQRTTIEERHAMCQHVSSSVKAA